MGGTTTLRKITSATGRTIDRIGTRIFGALSTRVASGDSVTGPWTVDYCPCIFMHGSVVLLYGFQHFWCPPLTLDTRRVGRFPDEDRWELLALNGPEELALLPPAVPL